MEKFKIKSNNQIGKNLFKEIYERSLNSIGITDDKGKYISINKAHVKLLGYSFEDLKNKTPEIYLGEDFQKVYSALKENGYFFGEVKCKRKDGKLIHCYLTAYKIELNGKTYFVGIKQDITQLKEKEQIIESIINQSEIGFAIYKEKFLYVNKGFIEKIGYTEEELKKMYVWDLLDEPYKLQIKENIHRRLKGEEFIYSDIIPIRAKDGLTKWIYLNASTIIFNGEYAGLSTFIDITEKKELEEKLYYIENFDQLTGLPNRELFKDKLDELIRSAKKHNEKVALILLDVFNFTEINDTYGKEAGDKILKEFSNRLLIKLHMADIIARYGSDEFAVAIKDMDIADILSYWTLETLKEILRKPFTINKKEIYLNYNIGFTIFPDDAESVEDLIANAEISLKLAKKKGSNEIYFFNKELNERIKKKVNLISQLKRAIQFREFDVYFQPKVDLKTGEIIGAEALARWKKVPPSEFIPALVEADLMFEAGCIITEKALEYAGKIIDKNPDFKIAINMSFEQLKYESCPRKLWELAAKYKVPSGNVIIEITETETMKNPQKNIKMLNAIREMGFAVSIDDFGTGYSSLKYLKIIPSSEIKIDRSFIKDLLQNENDNELVKVIISIGKIMGLKVVAEGIEYNEQWIYLKGLGCDIGQGYLFSPPVPFEEFLKLLKKQ